MTTVNFDYSTGNYCVVNISGHAGDTAVCNACSILAYTLMEQLQGIADVVFINELDGLFILDIPLTEERTEIVLNVILTGYRVLESNYPENVRVING